MLFSKSAKIRVEIGWTWRRKWLKMQNWLWKSRLNTNYRQMINQTSLLTQLPQRCGFNSCGLKWVCAVSSLTDVRRSRAKFDRFLKGNFHENLWLFNPVRGRFHGHDRTIIVGHQWETIMATIARQMSHDHASIRPRLRGKWVTIMGQSGHDRAANESRSCVNQATIMTPSLRDQVTITQWSWALIVSHDLLEINSVIQWRSQGLFTIAHPMKIVPSRSIYALPDKPSNPSL